MQALPDRVALGSLLTELGDVNICLYALDSGQHLDEKIYLNEDSLTRE
jgi:hypothetical protein